MRSNQFWANSWSETGLLRKSSNLSAQLTSKLEDFLNNPVSDQELAQNWLERNDAESYIVFGDPAVRLRIDLL